MAHESEGSRALVQDGSAKISKQLDEVEGGLSEQKGRLKDYKVAPKVRHTDTVEDLAFEAEEAIKALEKEKRSLLTELASDKIISKEQFFSKLDLETRDARFRANALLKRLGVQVRVAREERNTSTYDVSLGRKRLLVVRNTAGVCSTVPLTQDQVDKMKVLDRDGTIESALSLLAVEYALNELQGNKWDALASVLNGH